MTWRAQQSAWISLKLGQTPSSSRPRPSRQEKQMLWPVCVPNFQTLRLWSQSPRTSFNHSYRPFSQTSPSTNNKNIWRTKRTINLKPGDPAMKKKDGEEKLTESSFESRIGKTKERKQGKDKKTKTKERKQVKDKNRPKPALRGSTRRMTKVEPRGISFNIF